MNPCDCNSAIRTTPPLSATTKPGSKSLSVRSMARMVLPQACICRPDFDSSSVRFDTSPAVSVLRKAFNAGPCTTSGNCHLVWPTHAVEVIADITEHEIDLIEIGKMIDDFGPVCCGGTGRLRRGGYRKDGTSAGKYGSQNFASMHRSFPYPVWVEYHFVK